MPRVTKIKWEDAQALCDAGLLWEEGVQSDYLCLVPSRVKLKDWPDNRERIEHTHKNYYLGIIAEE